MDEPTVEPSWSMFPVKRYIVSGRVQGVGYRWFVCERARERNLAGHVMNRPDGTVEVVLAGEVLFMGELEQLMADGPPFAKVKNIEVEDVPPGSIDLPHRFELIHTYL